MTDAIERVARARCMAAGIDPDAPYRMPGSYVDVVNPPGWMVRLQRERAPNWRQFEREAGIFLAMLDAARG